MEEMLLSLNQNPHPEASPGQLPTSLPKGETGTEGLVVDGFRYLTKPWLHQAKAVAIAAKLPNYALFFDIGTGKTFTAINILRAKYLQHKRLLRTLVLGPPIIIENWRREIQRHSKVGDKVICLIGTGKHRAEVLRKNFDKPCIFVTNYESLLMTEVFALLNSWNAEAIVYDESHKLKNLKAKRTKLAIKLADAASYKLILSGTPILNSPCDIFSQFRVLDGGATFGKNLRLFQCTYMEDLNLGMPKEKYFPGWVPRPEKFAELTRKMAPLSMTVKKAECLDLPPLVQKIVYVDLSPEQARLYKAMKKDFIAYVQDKACVATLAITKALRLQQIVSGFVALEGNQGEERSNVSIKDNPRAQALRELLEDITQGNKCLVWCVFRQDYATVRAVCDDLGAKYVEVHGEVTPAARQKAVDTFNTEADVKVFLGHPTSGGIGINLVVASYAIFYSRNFSLENDLQAEGRNYRGGSEIHDKVTRIDLVAKDTIDELVLKRLADKQDISGKILFDLAGEL